MLCLGSRVKDTAQAFGRWLVAEAATRQGWCACARAAHRCTKAALLVAVSRASLANEPPPAPTCGTLRPSIYLRHAGKQAGRQACPAVCTQCANACS